MSSGRLGPLRRAPSCRRRRHRSSTAPRGMPTGGGSTPWPLASTPCWRRRWRPAGAGLDCCAAGGICGDRLAREHRHAVLHHRRAQARDARCLVAACATRGSHAGRAVGRRAPRDRPDRRGLPHQPPRGGPDRWRVEAQRARLGQQLPRTGRVARRPAGRHGLDCGARAVPVEFDAQPDQVVKDTRVQVAGDDRGHRGVAGDRLGRVAVQPGAGVPAAFGRGRPVPGPPRPHLRRPFLLQRGAAVQPEQVRQGDVRPHLHRLPGPFGEQPGRGQPAHGLLQRVVVPLLLGAGVLGAGRGGQGVQHSRDGFGTLGRQVTVQDTGALERRDQPHGPVVEYLVFVLVGGCGPGLLVDLAVQLGQVLQAHPGQGRSNEFLLREVALVLREPADPLAHDPGHGLGQVPGSQRRQDPRVVFAPPHPRGIGHRRALGHPGLVDQPGPRAVIGIRGVPPAGSERAQDRGPRRSADRGGPLQHPQAPCLLLGRHRRRIGRRQVPHRGLQHLQRLISADG